ncbi:MAG TPA: IS481 family transposase [bacterium]|nr:IS481 family transposase [bacterium]
MPRKKETARDGSRRAWPVELRVRAAQAVVEDGMSMMAVAKAFGVPHTTICDWVRRYRQFGADGLAPGATLSTRDALRKIDPRRKAVIDAKREAPERGTRRIRDILERFEGLGISETTVRRILHEEGLLERREAPKPKPRPEPKRFERAEPNQLWQSDLFTFLLRKHERIYVAAFMDDYSRFLVSLVMAHHQRSSLVMEALSQAIADYGAPREILTDQGRQYTAWRGETDFEEELRRNGIRHVKSRPHHPQTCGKIERFWKTMWDEFLSRTVFADFADCQRRVTLFVKAYNFQRPHQALEGLVPADRFFRAAPQVRAAIQKTVEENALRLAHEKPPQKPFYLVGRLGDRDLSIAASSAGLNVKVDDDEQTIRLPKESDDGETSTTRWNNREAPQEPLAPDAEMAAEGGEPRRDREGAMPDGASSALGRAAGDRGDRGSEDLARNVLPAGDEGAERDALRAQPAREPRWNPRPDLAGEADRAAAGEGEAARAGETSRGAVAVHDAEGDPADAGDDGARTEEAPQLDDEWSEAFDELGEADDDERRFDPDEGWRGRAVTWERKLASQDARDILVNSGEEQEDVHAGADDPSGAHGAIPGGPGRDRGEDLGERWREEAGTRAEPLSDDPSRGRDGDPCRDRTEEGRAPEEAGARGGVGEGVGATPEGKRSPEGSRGNDGPDAAARGWSPEGNDPADGSGSGGEGPEGSGR